MNEVYHTTERFLFEDLQGKKLEVDFDGGEVSSDAGVLFLREVERRMRLLERVAKILHDRRHPGYTRHSLLDMLKQRVFRGLYSGLARPAAYQRLRLCLNDIRIKYGEVQLEKMCFTFGALTFSLCLSLFPNL